MRFDHAGIATEDADATADLFAELLDTDRVHGEEFDGMRIVFLDLGDAYFEVLEPLGEEGAIARYLDRKGPGIHHVGIETGDAAAALETARGMGIETIDDEPRPGAWGHTVAFLHPRDTAGVLVEFVEH